MGEEVYHRGQRQRIRRLDMKGCFRRARPGPSVLDLKVKFLSIKIEITAEDAAGPQRILD
jgi:hypothetical protein